MLTLYAVFDEFCSIQNEYVRVISCARFLIDCLIIEQKTKNNYSSKELFEFYDIAVLNCKIYFYVSPAKTNKQINL